MATDLPAADLGATRRVTYVCEHDAEIPTDIHPSQAAPCPTCYPPAPDLGAQSFGECYCGDPLTLDHECYHWPPKACDCEYCAQGVQVGLPYLRALWQDRQDQAARLARIAEICRMGIEGHDALEERDAIQAIALGESDV